MVEYQTINAQEFKYGNNNFIEVARKKVEDNEFISMSKGYFTPDGQKRYKGGIGFPDEAELKQFIIETLGSI
ncbi:MAG: hypothetical protein JW834_03130 [Candidatus Diapherotrites archaeon]|nr:hypothetical protein [Candidatus Diapherotrites archaeon]